jgi:hypothetical protein
MKTIRDPKISSINVLKQTFENVRKLNPITLNADIDRAKDELFKVLNDFNQRLEQLEKRAGL